MAADKVLCGGCWGYRLGSSFDWIQDGRDFSGRLRDLGCSEPSGMIGFVQHLNRTVNCSLVANAVWEGTR